ncbi:MAG TPA: DMT family transporter [Treponemataceae bacterium]|nr:DMT family transporter [Treponemataceae bacterium]
MIRETKGTAIASLVLCALLWSSAGVLVKLVSWDSFAIAGIRSLVGLLTMSLFLGLPRLTFDRNQLFAAFFYSLTMILFVYANKMTSAANAVLLQYTSPVYLIILGRWLLSSEKAMLADWVTVVGVFCGMILFFLDDISLGSNIGNVLAVLSGVSFALTMIFMRRQKDGRPADSFMLAHALTFVVSLPFIIRGGVPSSISILGLVLLGVFQIGFSSILFGRGIRGVTAIESSIITMIEPAFNPVWVLIFIGERPSLRSLAGGAIILVCVTGRTVLKSRKI